MVRVGGEDLGRHRLGGGVGRRRGRRRRERRDAFVPGLDRLGDVRHVERHDTPLRSHRLDPVVIHHEREVRGAPEVEQQVGAEGVWLQARDAEQPACPGGEEDVSPIRSARFIRIALDAGARSLRRLERQRLQQPQIRETPELNHESLVIKV